jgi:hypothetical protein
MDLDDYKIAVSGIQKWAGHDDIDMESVLS